MKTNDQEDDGQLTLADLSNGADDEEEMVDDDITVAVEQMEEEEEEDHSLPGQNKVALSTKAKGSKVAALLLNKRSGPFELEPHVKKKYDLPTQQALLRLGNCQNFTCVQEMHRLLQGKTRFNFPHFFLAGWQKCATTSVNAYLRHHPQYLFGPVKESHWFSQCAVSVRAPTCHAHNESQYMQDFLRLDEAAASGLEKITSDASVDYARKGQPLASQLHSLFPWLKIVVIIREPISRVISYSRMYTEKQHGGKGCFGAPFYDCLQQFFEEGSPRTAHYDDALEGWLAVFPPSQIHVMQFEHLQEDPNPVITELKEFLGMDLQYPKMKLHNANNRKSGGYPMEVWEYEDLVARARPHAQRLADVLQKAGLADGEGWMRRWEEVWERQLREGCDVVTKKCLVNSN